MKTKYKYIEFRNIHDSLWGVWNHRYNDLLGDLTYNNKWKQWEFCPEPTTGFTKDCLEDIIDFIEQLQPRSNQENINLIKELIKATTFNTFTRQEIIKLIE